MKKFYLDILLLILFLLVMSFHFLPKVLHEVLGLIFCAASVIHFIWNRKALTLKKPLSLLIDLALLVCVIAITFTGICISNHIFNGMIDIRLQRNIWIHQLHVSLPFAFMILSGLHLGVHWHGFWQRIKNLLHLSKDTSSYNIVYRIVIAMIILAGVYGSILNQVGDRLMLQHIFATQATELPLTLFMLLMCAMIGMYVVIGFVIDRINKNSISKYFDKNKK